MAKRALIISAILISIIVVVSIIISLVSLSKQDSVDYQMVVKYDSNYNAVVEAPKEDNTNNDLAFLTTILSHERIIMASSLIVIILFAILFYGAKRSRS